MTHACSFHFHAMPTIMLTSDMEMQWAMSWCLIGNRERCEQSAVLTMRSDETPFVRRIRGCERCWWNTPCWMNHHMLVGVLLWVPCDQRPQRMRRGCVMNACWPTPAAPSTPFISTKSNQLQACSNLSRARVQWRVLTPHFDPTTPATGACEEGSAIAKHAAQGNHRSRLPHCREGWEGSDGQREEGQRLTPVVERTPTNLVSAGEVWKSKSWKSESPNPGSLRVSTLELWERYFSWFSWASYVETSKEWSEKRLLCGGCVRSIRLMRSCGVRQCRCGWVDADQLSGCCWRLLCSRLMPWIVSSRRDVEWWNTPAVGFSRPACFEMVMWGVASSSFALPWGICWLLWTRLLAGGSFGCDRHARWWLVDGVGWLLAALLDWVLSMWSITWEMEVAVACAERRGYWFLLPIDWLDELFWVVELLWLCGMHHCTVFAFSFGILYSSTMSCTYLCMNGCESYVVVWICI